MRQFLKTFFAALLAVIVGAVIFIGVFIGSISALVNSATKKTAVIDKSGAIMMLDLRRNLHEQRETNNFLFGGDAAEEDEDYNPGLYDVTNAIARAADDANVPALFIRTGGTPMGWASLQSIRNAVVAFRKSGKPVYAYGEDYSQKDYFVASAADSVFLNPVGDFELKGLAAQLQFFKGTLDKLGVQPEIFYAGKFKSATEPFRETKMTDANRAQLTVMINRLWSEFLTAAAEHTKTDTATIGEWTRQGAVLFPEDAVRLKLVDKLVYWDEMENILRPLSGIAKGEKMRFARISRYGNRVTGQTGNNKIAVLFAEGDIVDGRAENEYQIASESFVEEIRKIRRNDAVKAVVLRINSPGGSARASEIILRELKLLQQTKKLVVSMGDVAASGGYYMASSADSIFVQPTTLTGSIGVFSMMFNANGLLTDKLGVTFDAVKNAPYADFPNPLTPMNEAEKARMQKSVDLIYTLFKTRVSEGRKLSMEAVDSVAQGRVWLGRDALQNGLADSIGGLDRAIASAAKLTGISDYGIVTYPEPVDRFQFMLRRFKNVTATNIKDIAAQWSKTAGKTATQLERLDRMNRKVQTALPFDWEVE